MATRSNIGVLFFDGSIRSIYCHWDGHPDHQLPILTKHYNTFEKVKRLVNLGSLSALAESPECPAGHTYNTPVKGYCIAYARDRGEEFSDLSCQNLQEQLREMEEYLYLFDEVKGVWRWMSDSDSRLKKVPAKYDLSPKVEAPITVTEKAKIQKLIDKRSKLHRQVITITDELTKLGYVEAHR